MNVWDCFETLVRENNPRLMAIIETDDARYLLEVRDALKALTRAGVSKGRITNAKQLLVQPSKEAHHVEASPPDHTGAVAKPRLRRASRA
jgi:hypothetical protein